MQTQTNFAVTCRSGQTYETNAAKDARLPFVPLGTSVKLAGVAQRDEAEVRIGLCVAEFVTICEQLFAKANESGPRLTQAPEQPSTIQKDTEIEIETFADSVIADFIGWADINDVRVRERAALASAGYVTPTELEVLAARYKKYLATLFHANGGADIIIDQTPMPERAMRKFSDYEMTHQIFDAAKPHMVEHVVNYMILRHRGVNPERLISAMARAGLELIAQGFLKSNRD